MNKNEQLQIGSIIEYKGSQWIVYDWCPPCRLVWFEMLGKRGRAKYSEVKLLMY